MINQLTQPSVSTSLYIHIPWCIKKCPYCDFNSHHLATTTQTENNENLYRKYIDCLIEDYDQKYLVHNSPEIHSIFIGGGTPSLTPGKEIHRLLTAIRSKSNLEPNCEITLEANPGTFDCSNFELYLESGVNRLSIGVQSFSDSQLKGLGRIHNSHSAKQAILMAKEIGFENLNIDLMYGLPDQSIAQALSDIEQGLSFSPAHLSVYQLTIEPNTMFHVKPPNGLPLNDLAYNIQNEIVSRLSASGYERYEVSAYASRGKESRHNLNYWKFGDYIAIGAGAHGKRTTTSPSGSLFVERYMNEKHPEAYMHKKEKASLLVTTTGASVTPVYNYAKTTELTSKPMDIRFEFLMNAFRLRNGFDLSTYSQRTGLNSSELVDFLSDKDFQNLVSVDQATTNIRLNEKGFDHLDEVLTRCIV